MQSYFSLVLLGLILIVVATIIIKTIRYKHIPQKQIEPRLDLSKVHNPFDDGIIAVRKRERVLPIPNTNTSEVTTSVVPRTSPKTRPQSVEGGVKPPASNPGVANLIVIYVMAKATKTFAGYELLQSLLTAGMRFGEMNIFHRYSDLNGSNQVLFSLASATEPGTFEIQNMGAFAGRGLTIFMKKSDDHNFDLQRFDLMLKTAHQLEEDLVGSILDEKREQLTKDKIMAKKSEFKGVNDSNTVYV